MNELMNDKGVCRTAHWAQARPGLLKKLHQHFTSITHLAHINSHAKIYVFDTQLRICN